MQHLPSQTLEQLRAENQQLRTQLAAVTRHAASTPLLASLNWLDMVNDAIFITDATFHILYWNQMAEKMYGWSYSEVQRQLVTEIIPATQYLDGASNESVLHTLMTEGVWRGTFAQHTRDGREIIIEGSLRTLYDDQGAIVGFITINRDSTDRIRAERVQRQSEVQFASVFQFSPIGMAIIRATDGLILDTNASLLALIDYPRTEVVGAYWHSLPVMLDFVGYVELEGEQRTHGRIVNYPLKLHTRTGELRTILMSVEPFSTDEQKNIVSCIDISERVRAEAALIAEHERVNQLKNEFMATMSHELRTPLNAILAHTEMLIEGTYGALNTRQQIALQRIEASGTNLLVLISDIMDYTKWISNTVELNPTTIAIPSLCEESIRLVTEAAQRKAIFISTILDRTLTTIQADGMRLQQVLVNLLDNAIKFTPEGGKVVLEVHGDAVRQQATFTVWDTGIGITEADLPRLFQPFSQIDSRLTRSYVGAGLGLALVQRIVVAHGGHVAVESTLEQGSRFYVILPWKEQGVAPPVVASTAAPWPQPLPAPPAAQAFSAVAPLVLLVEDQLSNIAIIRDLCESVGYQLVVATQGSEGVLRAREMQPRLILMDIQLPGMSGIEAIQHIRADAALRHIPIIALSALVLPGDRERCLVAGADDYLPKPIQVAILRARMATQLARTGPTP